MLYGFIYNGYTYYYIRNILNDILGIVDIQGNKIVEYRYLDAWGNHSVFSRKVIHRNSISDSIIDGTLENVPNTDPSFIGNINPFRYKGYYYDKETGLFMMGQRYYNPKWGRFLQVSDVSELNPHSISGLNLYAYANNNTIGIAYSSSGFGGTTSGRMVSSSYGGSINISSTGVVANGRNSITRGIGRINWLKTNSVLMTHYTTSLIEDPVISWIFGNISYTTTVQLNSPETFYSFSNIGNDGYSVGVGMNLGNWYGSSVYVTSDIGFGSSWQLTPWLTVSSGWSLKDGISISGGIIVGDTTHEITISVGNGPLLGYAACAVLAAIPFPGARAVAATAACVIFIVDLFN